MNQNQELLKIVNLLRATDLESKQLGMRLFKQSLFIQQFRGNLSRLGFLIPKFGIKHNPFVYLSYNELCGQLTKHPSILNCFADNKYKAFLILKNNRLW